MNILTTLRTTAVALTLAFSSAHAAMNTNGSGIDGKTAFDRMKSLAGDWTGELLDGGGTPGAAGAASGKEMACG